MNIFNCVRDNELKEVTIIKKNLKKGDILFEQGKKCSELAYVLKGKFEAKTNYDNLNETTIRIINENNYIGINLLFSSSPIYMATFICLEDAIVELIKKEDLLKILKKDEKTLNSFLNTLSDVAVNQNEYLKMVNVKTIKGKICYFLYQEYRKNNSLEFDIKYTKTALSKTLHVERPSLGFEIKNLVDEAIIENKNKHYKILSLEKLLSYIEK